MRDSKTLLGSVCVLCMLATGSPGQVNEAAAAGDTNAPALECERPGTNLLMNSDFALGLRNWQYWQYANKNTNWVSIINNAGARGNYRALRIADPEGTLVGVQQLVSVKSGMVYRLSSSARSMITNSSGIIFGGRIGFRLPPQPERQLVWTSEFDNWWRKQLVFTSEVTGVAVVFIHMGYGNKASTGEFADVRLEKL